MATVAKQGYNCTHMSHVSRENCSSARWRPVKGGRGPRNDAKSLAASLAVATLVSLRPMDAPRVELKAPPLLMAAEYPPFLAMFETLKGGEKGETDGGVDEAKGVGRRYSVGMLYSLFFF